MTTRIDAIRARLEAVEAYPGPWRAVPSEAYEGLLDVVDDECVIIADGCDRELATFLAHAREDIVHLLAELGKGGAK
ncbi:MAG TPA: hypothetical protein VFS43_38225 [Polyangiaceae bacterium]|nr:hypothetical protein [Polyangiaceae bacterium]